MQVRTDVSIVQRVALCRKQHGHVVAVGNVDNLVRNLQLCVARLERVAHASEVPRNAVLYQSVEEIVWLYVALGKDSVKPSLDSSGIRHQQRLLKFHHFSPVGKAVSAPE